MLYSILNESDASTKIYKTEISCGYKSFKQVVDYIKIGDISDFVIPISIYKKSADIRPMSNSTGADAVIWYSWYYIENKTSIFLLYTTKTTSTNYSFQELNTIVYYILPI